MSQTLLLSAESSNLRFIIRLFVCLGKRKQNDPHKTQEKKETDSAPQKHICNK